jgi:hypothetical protein
MNIAMPTSKKRLNVTLSDELEEAIRFLAKRDNVPEATKAAELLKAAVEIDEDEVWNRIAEERDTEDAIFISSDEFWKDVLQD